MLPAMQASINASYAAGSLETPIVDIEKLG